MRKYTDCKIDLVVCDSQGTKNGGVTCAEKALTGSGITCPPLDDRLLETYFGYFTRSGYLPSGRGLST